MIPVQSLIEVFRGIVGWPYASPGVNGPKGIDCSGAFVYAYRQFGQRIYHGSNRIIRVYCRDVQPVNGTEGLRPGMAIFRSRRDTSRMKAEYRPGGRYYNPALPEDFYHMGLIASVSPLQIINATSPKARVDTSLRRWTHAGYLKAVDYESGDAPTAVVTAESGSSVNLRKAPNRQSPILARVPLGQTVTLLACDDEAWHKIRWQNKTGYMMKEFLKTLC